MLTLIILGNNSALPAFDRNPTAQVLQTIDESYLIDCGEGTQLQMMKYNVRRSRLHRIFISHLHGDHYFGLIGLISSMSLLGRIHELHIHGPRALEEIIRMQLKMADTKLTFKLTFHPIKKEEIIVEDKHVSVETFRVKHRIECWGFIFREKRNPRKVDPEQTGKYDVPTAFYEMLQRGFDYTTADGTVVPNYDLTTAAPKPKKYVYCADTVYDEGLANVIKYADLLYHETTYLKEDSERAASRYHSTTVQAGTIAALSKSKKLLIGHFSSKYEALDEFLTETKEVFENTELAMEGATYEV